MEKEFEKEELRGRMSFMAHLDEFRKRLVYSIIAVGLAFIFCFIVSKQIFNFLSVPITRAITEAERVALPIEGLAGDEKIRKLAQLTEGETGRFVFERPTNLGTSVLFPGTSVMSVVKKDAEGKLGLFTDEEIFTARAAIPKGVKLDVDLSLLEQKDVNLNEKLIVTTAVEPFVLKMTVALYSAIALALPFLLLQIWSFISPALYRHERKYVTPFILLSSISFVLGAAFAYYILFPPAVRYLLALGSDFSLFLKATDYLDFIILIMLAMGFIFQMPAVTYVLARIGIISAGLMIRSWKVAIVVMLIVAAFVSPTGDIPNLMLFATPMFVLYMVSIFVAWFFGKKRETDAEHTD